MIYLVLKEWDKALHFLSIVIASPAINSVSTIMVEAYKKWILASLLKNGEVSLAPVNRVILSNRWPCSAKRSWADHSTCNEGLSVTYKALHRTGQRIQGRRFSEADWRSGTGKSDLGFGESLIYSETYSCCSEAHMFCV